MIIERLRHGKENAISAHDLMQLCGISDRRTLYEVIERERTNGAVILSNKGAGGYYLPGSPAELKEFVAVTEKGLRTSRKALAAAKKLLRSCIDINSLT